ncbi:unnamed protein product [Rotaria socialis]|uniref:Uncharacterized protein n=1 Tax=Rotaria socialis TaxID=392032 RepID=A0A818ETP0_9BILA|nr:unnamed protein product [Rotaria socialis]CAF4546031.1 unnamed protein product [Rotaria socialis]
MSNSNSDSCQVTDDGSDSYNLTLRIISVFVLLIVSFAGASITIFSSYIKFFRIHPIIINAGKYFGAGVILGTGFIHTLPGAMSALTDECLPDSWKEYESYAGLFAMIAVLLMQLIEVIAHHQLHRTPKKEQKIVVENIDSTPYVIPVEDCQQQGHSHGLSLLDEDRNRRITTYLLEFGIVIHSVLIGVTLGTEDGSTFVALFIALCFHQFFEAIALGAQIALLNNKSILPGIMMVIFYSFTTPIGIAIGIGVHITTYNPKSVAALLSTGILDAASTGILIYVALVDLIAAEMGPGAHRFFELKTRVKILYFIALYLGAAFMAVIGRWG